MTTAFQGNAFQSNAFQIEGGVLTAGAFTLDTSPGAYIVTGFQIAFSLEGGATGGWPIYYPRKLQRERETAKLLELERQAKEAERHLILAKSRQAKEKERLRLQKIVARQIEQENLLAALTTELVAEMAAMEASEDDEFIPQFLLEM